MQVLVYVEDHYGYTTSLSRLTASSTVNNISFTGHILVLVAWFRFSLKRSSVMCFHVFHQQPTEVRLSMPLKARVMNGRVCWIQKRHSGRRRDVWAVDAVRLFPVLEDDNSYYVQFLLNMKCGYQPASNARSTVRIYEY